MQYDCGCAGIQLNHNNNHDNHEKEHNGASDDECANVTPKMNIPVCPDAPLVWRRRPQKVLLAKKRDVDELKELVKKIATYLKSHHNITPVVEPSAEEEFKDFPDIEALKPAELPLTCASVDFIISLGGDGLLLHINSLFGDKVPPVLAFFCGTLGFLTPFDINDYEKSIDAVVKGDGVYLNYRTRLECVIYRTHADADAHEDNSPGEAGRTKFHVLNECVMDRGPSSFITDVDCFCNDEKMTTIRADGIIVATATGSTAYSLSAGASMVHPMVPALLLTPICPHSLSFRPVIFPNCVRLKLQVSMKARTPAWISFDGRFRKRLDPGEFVTIQVSEQFFPSVVKKGVLNQWFQDIARVLKWNDPPSH